MKKRLQKVMTLFLSTAMTVAMLAGCGDSGNDQGGGSGAGDNTGGGQFPERTVPQKLLAAVPQEP